MTSPAPGRFADPNFAPPPLKKKPMSWVFGGLFGALLLVAAAIGSRDRGEAPGFAVAATAGSLGAPVWDGKLEFIVTDVTDGQPSIGEGEYTSRQAQGKFVIVTMTVKNTDDEPHSFTPSNQKLLDAEGRSFQSDAAAQMYLDGNGIPIYGNINPGKTVIVKAVFDMPTDAKPESIELHDSMLSGGVKVSLG